MEKFNTSMSITWVPTYDDRGDEGFEGMEVIMDDAAYKHFSNPEVASKYLCVPHVEADFYEEVEGMVDSFTEVFEDTGCCIAKSDALKNWLTKWYSNTKNICWLNDMFARQRYYDLPEEEACDILENTCCGLDWFMKTARHLKDEKGNHVLLIKEF